MSSKEYRMKYKDSTRTTAAANGNINCILPAPEKTPFMKRCFLKLQTILRQLIKKTCIYIAPIRNPYTEGEFTIKYYDKYRIVRVPRSFSLKFMEDIYNYEMLRQAKTVKVYVYENHEEVVLKKDKYNRLWLHVYWEDGFDDRTEEVFDWVPDEKEADKRYKETGGGPHYYGQLPHFFASENYDFILHEEVTKPGSVVKEMRDILKMNNKIVRKRIVDKMAYLYM